MQGKTWRMKWQAAYNQAGFYHSEKNTREHWDEMARTGGGGVSITERIRLLSDYLFSRKLLDNQSSLLDIGCGRGEYTAAFAEKCSHVTAMDYSAKMLHACKERCKEHGLSNVTFVPGDFMQYPFNRKYDCVMACLNPATYQPDALDKMLLLAEETIVYFSMDTPLEGCEKEPVYCGCNSVRYAEEYLKELEVYYCKIPFRYAHNMGNGQVREFPFAYLIISAK